LSKGIKEIETLNRSLSENPTVELFINCAIDSAIELAIELRVGPSR